MFGGVCVADGSGVCDDAPIAKQVAKQNRRAKENNPADSVRRVRSRDATARDVLIYPLAVMYLFMVGPIQQLDRRVAWSGDSKWPGNLEPRRTIEYLGPFASRAEGSPQV